MLILIRSLATVASAVRSTNMPYPFPSIAGSASFQLCWLFPNGGTGARYYYTQFNFITTGDMPVTGTTTDYNAAQLPYLFYPFEHVMPPGVGFYQFRVRYLLPSRIVDVPTLNLYSFYPIPEPIVGGLGAAIFLRTATHGKNYTGRFHWPFLGDGDFDGSRLTSSFTSRMDTLLTSLATPFTFYGVTHQLAVWSRALNILTPVTHWTICPRASWLNKRRSRAAGCKTFPPNAYPGMGLLPYPF